MSTLSVQSGLLAPPCHDVTLRDIAWSLPKRICIAHTISPGVGPAITIRESALEKVAQFYTPHLEALRNGRNVSISATDVNGLERKRNF